MVSAAADRPYEGGQVLETMDEAVTMRRYWLSLVQRTLPPGGEVLDFGAGRGAFASEVHGLGYRVRCLEPDPTQRALIAARGLPLVGQLEALPAASLDGVYAFNVLEHLPDDLGTVAQWRRVLRPGGVALAYVPALDALWTRFDERVGHLRRYTKRSLLALFADGFDVLEAAYADVLGVPAALAYRLLDRSDGGLDPRALRLYDRFVFPLSRLADRAAQQVLGKNVYVVARRR